MTTRGRPTGGLQAGNTAFQNHGQESPSERLLTLEYNLWVCRVVGAPHHNTRHPLTMEGNMRRYGKLSKSNELHGVLGRVTRAVLVIASLAVTRLGVLLLVGW